MRSGKSKISTMSVGKESKAVNIYENMKHKPKHAYFKLRKY